MYLGQVLPRTTFQYALSGVQRDLSEFVESEIPVLLCLVQFIKALIAHAKSDEQACPNRMVMAHAFERCFQKFKPLPDLPHVGIRESCLGGHIGHAELVAALREQFPGHLQDW